MQTLCKKQYMELEEGVDVLNNGFQVCLVFESSRYSMLEVQLALQHSMQPLHREAHPCMDLKERIDTLNTRFAVRLLPQPIC